MLIEVTVIPVTNQKLQNESNVSHHLETNQTTAIRLFWKLL